MQGKNQPYKKTQPLTLIYSSFVVIMQIKAFNKKDVIIPLVLNDTAIN